MKQCAIQQQNLVAGREEMRRDYVVCPKPRRLGLGLLNATINDTQPVRSIRWNLSHHLESSDSKAGSDLFDIILPKGGMEMEQSCTCTQVLATSPPFFCGSPPSRVANPLIHDSRFGDEKITPMSPLSPSPSSARKPGGGYVSVRPNFGNKPAVRIEGFDCRDQRNCSIPALA